MEKLFLSIVMPAFNEQLRIADAVDSVFNQNFNKEFEFIILDDGSTDETFNIIKRKSKRYKQIKIIKNEKNLGISLSRAKLLSACTGKYIATIDADDKWTDCEKLNKQIEILESNSSISICIHKQKIVYSDKIDYTNANLTKDQIFDLDDFLNDKFYAQYSSFVFRNPLLSDRIDWLLKNGRSDLLLLVYMLHYGDAYFINEDLADYNYTGVGDWSSLNEEEKHRLSISSYEKLYSLVAESKIDLLETLIDRHKDALSKIL